MLLWIILLVCFTRPPTFSTLFKIISRCEREWGEGLSRRLVSESWTWCIMLIEPKLWSYCTLKVTGEKSPVTGTLGICETGETLGEKKFPDVGKLVRYQQSCVVTFLWSRTYIVTTFLLYVLPFIGKMVQKLVSS